MGFMRIEHCQRNNVLYFLAKSKNIACDRIRNEFGQTQQSDLKKHMTMLENGCRIAYKREKI